MPNARDLAADLLLRHDRRGGRIGPDLDAARARLGDGRERGLLTELAYGCIRRRGTLDALIGSVSKRPVQRLHASLRTALRLALYQAFFLDRVPVHAAVDHAVGWSRKLAGAKRAGFVNGVVRNLLRGVEGTAVGAEDPRRDVPREDGTAVRLKAPVFADPDGDPAGNLAARYSMPRWLVERWLAHAGATRSAQMLRTGLQRPPLTLRARGARDDLAAALQERGIAFEAGPGAAALRVDDGEAAVALAVASGIAAVQDATSQRVAPLLAPRPGEDVLDLCAAPGGKTLHLADLMGRGRLTACDVDEAKVAQLEALRPLLGDVAYETRCLEPEADLPFEAGRFDAVLVDAPCSNTGVLRRRVEVRWRLVPGDLVALAGLQARLLDRCVPVLKPGGRLLYSTCSVEPEENEEVVTAFLARHPGFTAEPAVRSWPRAASDGGFAVLLRAP